MEILKFITFFICFFLQHTSAYSCHQQKIHNKFSDPTVQIIAGRLPDNGSKNLLWNVCQNIYHTKRGETCQTRAIWVQETLVFWET